MAKAEKPELRKYKIKNIANGPVHVKELRKALKAGAEVKWIGVLTEGTKRLEEKKFLAIKDLGVAKEEDMPKRKRAWPDPLERKVAQEDKERKLTAEVRENLAKTKKEEKPKAKVEAVKMDDDLDAPPEPVEEPKEEKKSTLDSLFGGKKKKSKKKTTKKSD